MAYEVRIERFEGPLDLLLHLIRKNEMDIYDIPMADITAQYLATLDTMKSLNLDVAGEFLLMAATLIHIKSRMLLPLPQEEEPEAEEEDPRAELVRRLLAYQKYKEAANALNALPLLGRDIFSRLNPALELEEPAESGFQVVGLYELAEALRALLEERPEESFHEVGFEQLSVTDRINGILSRLAGRESIGFEELFLAPPDRAEVVVTFLAMLELVRLKLLRLLQNNRYGQIRIYPAVDADEMENLQLEDETLGYG
jgi:segregation and condensation protein A